MILTRVDTSHYNGQSPCFRCNPSRRIGGGVVCWSSMMVEFKEIPGHYCSDCARIIEDAFRCDKDF